MVSKRDGSVVLWPTYFEASRSRRDGRRVPQDLAVGNPSASAIRDAAQQLGYDASLDKAARHPSRPWEATGRVLVEEPGTSKEALLREVAEVLAAGD